MGKYNGPSSFKTGNATVATLPEGTQLVVSGPGELEIVEIPVDSFEAGDRVNTKYGPSTVVRMTSRLVDPVNEGQILYVADLDPVVRIASVDDVASL